MSRRRSAIIIGLAAALFAVIGLFTGKVDSGAHLPMTAAEQTCALQQTRIHLDNPFQRAALAFGRLEVVDRTRRDFTIVARTALDIPFTAVTVYDCPGHLLASTEPTPELMRRYVRIVEIFTMMRVEISRTVGMPEGGYLPGHVLGFYPGLEPQDFNGIEAEGGTYSLIDGVLAFDQWATGAETHVMDDAALGTLSTFDMGRVFDAVRHRTGVDWEAADGKQAFMDAISAADASEEDIVLYDANGVRISERPRASSKYRIGNVEGTIEFREMLVDTGLGNPIVVPYEVQVVGLTSIRSVNDHNVVLAYGDGFSKTSQFWVVDRERETVMRHEARPHFGQWLAVTADGGIIYRTSDEVVLADAGWHRKKSIPFTDGEEVVAAAALSGNGARLALVTWNGAYEPNDARYVVHALDVMTDEVFPYGEVSESFIIIWDDGDAFRTGLNAGRAPIMTPEDVTGSFSVPAVTLQ